MADFTTEEVCTMHFDTISSQYPGLTYNHYKNIVKSQWSMLKDSMQGESYKPVRLHYFGIFKATVPNSKICLKYAQATKEKGLLSEKEFNRINLKIKNILEYYEKEK